MEITTPPVKLSARLRHAATLWVDATGLSLARLGRAAVNDSSFFKRLDGRGGVTTASLERFGHFFSRAANWPEGEIPEEVRGYVHVVGISADEVAPCTGKIGGMSGGQS